MTLGLTLPARITLMNSGKVSKREMMGEMGAEGRFKPEPQSYGHVVKLVVWQSLEFTLKDTLVKFLRTRFVISYNYTWRGRLVFNLYANFAKDRSILQMLK